MKACGDCLKPAVVGRILSIGTGKQVYCTAWVTHRLLCTGMITSAPVGHIWDTKPMPTLVYWQRNWCLDTHLGRAGYENNNTIETGPLHLSLSSFILDIVVDYTTVRFEQYCHSR